MGRFSYTLRDHCSNPRGRGPIPSPCGVGMASKDGQSPHIVIYLYMDHDRIRDVRFQATGCGVAIACGSILCELLPSQTARVAPELTAESVMTALGGIPSDKRFFTDLAVRALRNALESLEPCDRA